jgi:hypothetical protein
LAVLAAAGLLLAVAADLPGPAWLLRWSVRHLPGAGLLRDGQKWLMPLVLLTVLAGGLAVDRLTGWLITRAAGAPDAERPRPVGRLLVLAVAAAVLPLLLLPDGPAALRTPLDPVRYPAGWRTVAARVAGSTTEVLVLPFASYRTFGWAPGRTVLDPAPRLLAPPVVVDDRLAVNGTVLAGEDPAAARVRGLLDSRPPAAKLAERLAAAGIGWVVVEAGTPGPPPPDLSSLRLVVDGPDVRLYQVPGSVRQPAADPARTALVLGVDLLLALLVALAAVAKLGRAALRLLHSPVTFAEQLRRAGRS